MARLVALLSLLLLLPWPAFSRAEVPGTSSHSLVDLRTPWRVHAGDDPAFRDPDLNDTGWTTLELGQPFAKHFTLPPGNGVFWARTRVRTDAVAAALPMGLGLVDDSALPFTLFLNGTPVRQHPQDGSGQARRLLPFAVRLPATGEVTVAMRFSFPARYRPVRLPISRVTVGPLAQVELTERLAALNRFDEVHIAEIVGIGLFLGLAAFAFTLYLLQPTRAEYLALGLFCLAYSVTAIMKILVETGSVAETDSIMLLYRYAGCLSMIASLEFVSFFSQVRWHPADRFIEGLFLAAPIFGQITQTLFNLVLVLCLFLLLLYVCACFLRAARRGVAEIRLLLPFLALLVLVDTAYYASYLFPRLLGLPRLHLGSVGIGAEDLAVLTFIVGILTVVLYRFHRVYREEQHTFSEFRAARRLQQALIPELPPAVPGFQIATAYHPAQEVGGDFFQILPLPCDSGVLLAIGDVSGKGLEAAMTVAVIIGALRTLTEYTDSPAALMAGLNRRLLDRGAGFCTCTILRMDPYGEVIASSAGHLQPYLEGVELCLDAGLPLGLLAEATFDETTLHCGPGEQLTLLTDGVVEARRPRTLELFGFERTRALSRAPAREIAEQAIAFGAGLSQPDDITVLTVVRL